MSRSNNILYLSYWGVNDVLSSSSVFPSLRCLSGLDSISKIIFCSVERSGHVTVPPLPPKTIHVPLISRKFGSTVLTKVSDFSIFPIKLLFILKKYNINTIICRSSLAGGLIWPAAWLTGIKVVVESFEPHSDYMVESNIWTPQDVRTRSAKRMESRLRSNAEWLLPVSENYYRQLLSEGVPASRMQVVPCTVQIDKFAFNPDARRKIRSSFGWNEMIVGIYVGKFGGIYYEAEAFEQFSKAFEYFGTRMCLIILTVQQDVEAMVKKYMSDAPADRVKVLSVPHAAVPDYLSAADFAFSTIKPAPSRKFCSPIKHGEYWAAGLPIIVEDGIGDDSTIVKNQGGGVILERPMYEQAFREIETQIHEGREKLYPDIRKLAEKYRSETLIKKAYQMIFK